VTSSELWYYVVQTHPNPWSRVPRLVYLTNTFYVRIRPRRETMCFNKHWPFPFSINSVNTIQCLLSNSAKSWCMYTPVRYFSHSATAPSGPGPHNRGFAITLTHSLSLSLTHTHTHTPNLEWIFRVRNQTGAQTSLLENIQHSTIFAIYHNAVRHTTGSALFLKHSLLLVSCPNMPEHVRTCIVWLGWHAYCLCYDLVFIPTVCLTFQSLAVSLRTTRLNIQNSTWCSLCVECFVRISEKSGFSFIRH
jgi:hypothetical protein